MWLTTTYGYDSLGNILSSTNPLNPPTNYSYSDRWTGSTGCATPADSHAYVTEITNPATFRIQFTYYRCTGLTKARADENDLLNNRPGTTFLYDLFGRLTQASYPDGGQISTSYVDAIPFRTTTTSKINATLNLVREIEHDGLGRQRVTRLLSDPQGTIYTRTVYDALGRVVQMWNPTRCNPDGGPCTEVTGGITLLIGVA
jgi:hypothetical protein